MYKNIIFDFGGVVVNFNPRDFLMDNMHLTNTLQHGAAADLPLYADPL